MRLIARPVPMDRATGPRRHRHMTYPVSVVVTALTSVGPSVGVEHGSQTGEVVHDCLDQGTGPRHACEMTVLVTGNERKGGYPHKAVPFARSCGRGGLGTPSTEVPWTVSCSHMTALIPRPR